MECVSAAAVDAGCGALWVVAGCPSHDTASASCEPALTVAAVQLLEGPEALEADTSDASDAYASALETAALETSHSSAAPLARRV